MSKEERKVPELRFKGFYDDWEQRKLGDVSEITKLAGFEFTKYIIYSKEGNVPAIRGLNVKNGNFDFSDVKYIDNSELSKLNRSKLLYQDIVFTYVGTIGDAALVPKDVNWYLAPNVARIRSVTIKPEYLFQVLTSSFFKNKEIKKWITSSSQPALSMENIRKFNLVYPDYNEQNNMADFFKKLDRLVVLHQRKINTLNTLRKAYLNKVFPFKGENTPRIRFNDFNEEWEQRELGEVSDIVGGGTPSTKNPDYWGGDIDWYSPAELKSNIFVDDSQRKITELGLKNSSARILPEGTVLFTSRAGIGNTAILAKESATNQGFQSIVPKDNMLDTYFIYSKSHLLKRYGEVQGAGSTFVEISGKEMAKMPLLLPTIKEQIRIGTYLKNLDNIITIHQGKVNILNKLKKLYLHKMFL